MTGEFVSKNEEETYKLAADFVANLETKFPSSVEGAHLVGLYGELGAGKTTFMKGVAKAFGINETVQSPTFVIEKIYELQNTKFEHLIHIDAYRIEKSDELVNLGWNEITRDPKNIIFIEWPERVIDIMPEHAKIYFEHLENARERKIKIEY